MKKIIYTVIFGDGDTLKLPTYVTPGWEYYVWTDQVIDDLGPWQKIPAVIDSPNDDRNIKLASRAAKIHPAILKADILVYVDGTYRITGDLDEFVKGMEDGVHMTPHPQRKCLYSEAEVVIKKQLDSAEKVTKQIERYRAEGYPENNGLYRGGCIVRIGDTSKFNEVWWREVKENSWRDQISMCYASWKTGIPIHPIEHGRVEKFFKPHLHNPRDLKRAPVFFNPEDPFKVPKNSWTVVGNIDAIEVDKKISLHPNSHCIKTKEGIIYQSWLRDYLPEPSDMIRMTQIYNGSFVDYTFSLFK